jgi:hypothetical protein
VGNLEAYNGCTNARRNDRSPKTVTLAITRDSPFLHFLPYTVSHLCYDGPNLAKGDFLANSSRSEVQIGEESGRHADEHAQNGAQGDRKVRIMGRLRSFGCTDSSNPGARAAELRQTVWLNRKNELLVHAPALLGNHPVSTWPIFGASLD